MNLIDREGLVAVYINPKTLEPNVLSAARPNTGSDAMVKKMMAASLDAAKKSGSRIKTVKAGGFPINTIVSPDLGAPISMGYQGGIAYAALDINTLGGFLKRVGGSKEPALASSSLYKTTMDSVGSATMRTYADLGQLAGLAKTAVQRFDLNEQGFKLQPLLNALTTLGRYGSAWKVSSEGLETTGVFAPDMRGGDAALYKLLTTVKDVPLTAAEVVPATALTFQTGSSDPQGFYDYINKLVDQSKLNPGGIDPLLTKELGLNFRQVALEWMTGEFASATFETKPKPNASNAVSLLGETVVYIGASDEALAQNSLEAVLPRLVELGNKLAENEKALSYKPSKATIAGTEVTRYPIAQGLALTSAVSNGYLLIATSDDAMVAALAQGPRLNESAAYKAAMARVPANASGYAYADTSRSFLVSSKQIEDNLTAALALGADMRPSVARKLSQGLQKLMTFTADRVGPQVTWTEVKDGVIRTKSFQPVRW